MRQDKNLLPAIHKKSVTVIYEETEKFDEIYKRLMDETDITVNVGNTVTRHTN